MMENKFKKGDWITIIKVMPKDGFEKYQGYSFPIMRITKEDTDHKIKLPMSEDEIFYEHIMNEKIDNDIFSRWSEKELRLATPEEIENALEKYGAELL